MSDYRFGSCRLYCRYLCEGAKVVCEVLSPLVKGDKVLVFHKKRRKGYRKLNGHRQQFTEVSVKEIVA